MTKHHLQTHDMLYEEERTKIGLVTELIKKHFGKINYWGLMFIGEYFLKSRHPTSARAPFFRRFLYIK